MDSLDSWMDRWHTSRGMGGGQVMGSGWSSGKEERKGNDRRSYGK